MNNPKLSEYIRQIDEEIDDKRDAEAIRWRREGSSMSREQLEAENAGLRERLAQTEAKVEALGAEVERLKESIPLERVRSRLMGLEDGAQAFGDESIMAENQNLIAERNAALLEAETLRTDLQTLNAEKLAWVEERERLTAKKPC
jgi:hypothetical protein